VPENGTEENIWMIKTRRIRWAVHVTGIGERTACRILVENTPVS
jgi:hypothetical protein